MIPSQRRCIALGSIWLGAGLVVYALARPDTVHAILGATPVPRPRLPSTLVALLGPVPTLTHAAAFSLFTAAVLGARARWIACGAWALIEIAFELAQQSSVSAWLLAHGAALPFTVRAYLAGTFDPADLLAAVAGAGLALWSLTPTRSDRMRIHRHLEKAALLAVVTVTGIVTIVASGGGGTPAPPAPPPTTGLISVSMAFGAVTSTPYQCTGGGSVTATPVSLSGSAGTATATTQQFSYGGNSSTTPNQPACQQAVTFPNMRPGSWSVSSGGTTCPASVVAGQPVTVKIWNNACA